MAIALSTQALPGNSLHLGGGLSALCTGCLALAAAARGLAAAAGKPAGDAVDGNEWSEIQAVLGGDGEAYARLIRTFQQPIADYMWRFTRNRQQWEELVHEVFVEAYFSLRGFRGKAPLLHWLRRIATRVGYRHWTRRARARAEAAALAAAEPRVVLPQEPAEEADQAAAVVYETLARMAPRDRLVLTLFYWEDQPVAEIARLVGWTQTMVKVQLHRARNRLKKLLQQEQPSWNF